MIDEEYQGAFLVSEPLEIHPIALIMPPMTPEEFQEFKEDISGQGLLEPIVLFQDMVLDGRNRYNACVDLGIDVWARKWEGGMDPVEYVVSKNIHRRQLTPAQRAMCAAKAMGWHSEQAKLKQREAGRFAGRDENGNPVVKEEFQLVAPVQQPEEPAAPAESTPAKEPEVIQPERASAFEQKAISQAGKQFHVSGRSVAAAKTILEHGTPEEIKAVETGQAALKPVEQQVRERIREEQQAIQSTMGIAPKRTTKAMFNATTDSVEWARWTWNPVTGCNQGCPYCYARDIAKRYPDAFPNGFEPMFHPDRLDAPQNTNVPRDASDETNVHRIGHKNVFVCSMADLFGSWVPQEWIDAVLESVRNAPQWNFLFLTKNPSRMVDIVWPANAWVGTTVDCQDRVQPAVDAFARVNATVKFLSCEPMREELIFPTLKPFHWVIIGGQSASSGCPAEQPEWRWVWNLTAKAYADGCSVYWKPNLKIRPREYPNWE